MKPLHKLILITLFFAILQQSESAASKFANDELCKNRESGNNQDLSTIVLTTIVTSSINQNTCVQRFTLDLSDLSFHNAKYIYIEVQFTSMPSPPPDYNMILLEGDDYQPIIYQSRIDGGLYEDVTTDDYDAYRNNKTFHRIVLDTSNIRKGGIRYFAVYKLFDDIRIYPQNSHVVSYTIQARVSNEFECINDCQGQGDCDKKLQQCKCYPGYFGSDCSVSALRLNSGISQTQTIPAGQTAYYYTPYQSEDDILSFSFKMSYPRWNFAVQWNKPNDFLINSRRAFQITYLQPILAREASQDYSAAQIEKLKSYVGGEVILAITNPNDEPLRSTVQIDYPVKEKSKLLLTIAIVAGIVLFLIVIGACITAKCRARAARSARSIELQVVVQGEPGQRGQRGNRAQQQQPVFLTKADIEKYFPLKKFSDMKSGFLQSSCSICLDEFTADSKCHQLYCEHIFHDNCIESWLAKQSNCPNCKSEMDKKSIRKFLRENNNPQKSAKPQENKPQSQQIELNINPGNPRNEQPEQAEQEDRGNLENSVYENSEENPIELQSPIGSPVGSPHSSRMLTGGDQRFAPNI